MRKPALTLHIGCEKTGTTALQQSLNANKSLLDEQQIFIPSFLGCGNNRWFPVMFYNGERNDEFTKKYFDGFNPALRGKRIADKVRELDTILDQTNYTHWIISSEHLQSRLLDISEVMRLHEFVMGRYSKVNIVIYIRDPIATALASWSTSVISGGTAASLPPPNMMKHNCDHNAILRRWSTVFNSNLIVRKYVRKELLNHSVVDDFLQIAGVDASRLNAPANLANESLSYTALRVLARINSKIPLYSERGAKNVFRKNIASFIRSRFRALPRYTPTIGEFSHYRKYYQLSDLQIAHEYFGKQGILWPESYLEFLAEAQLSPNHEHMISEDHIAIFSDIISQLWIERFKLNDSHAGSR